MTEDSNKPWPPTVKKAMGCGFKTLPQTIEEMTSCKIYYDAYRLCHSFTSVFKDMYQKGYHMSDLLNCQTESLNLRTCHRVRFYKVFHNTDKAQEALNAALEIQTEKQNQNKHPPLWPLRDQPPEVWFGDVPQEAKRVI